MINLAVRLPVVGHWDYKGEEVRNKLCDTKKLNSKD